MKFYIELFKVGYDWFGKVVGWLMENVFKNYDYVGVVFYEIFNIFGIVSIGWMWV